MNDGVLFCAGCSVRDERIAALVAKIEELVAAPTNGTATSNEAADEIKPHMSAQRRKVLEVLEIFADHGGLTADAIEWHAHMAGNSVRPRLRELDAFGWVERTEEMRTTSAGRRAYVWRITQAGHEILKGRAAA